MRIREGERPSKVYSAIKRQSTALNSDLSGSWTLYSSLSLMKRKRAKMIHWGLMLKKKDDGDDSEKPKRASEEDC